ncbi:hypothetical protein ASD68_15460 [Rhodanobacter sp. Root627]|uniref:DUF6270 domain-containing protein n=1 Tax=Rhodanobacter sp. Root627 TaxID=1736572 RepID=UPI0006F79CA0|nr:DUF6270 domain-containing protein [Rhodanobacter sp. Root627]KRA30242.1 hypothetical protein ASD68_15460 [Rhodanobacter sp. Root627]
MKIAIFGSCVSRDAFAFAPKPGLEVAEYIARSSMASAFHKVPLEERWLSAVERIESPFQRRMVECDLRKLAEQRLLASSADVVLVDLVDERFNLVALGNSFATWSSEFSKLGFDPAEFDAVLRIESNERKPLWREGAQAMLQAIGANRIVLNEVYWARELADGQPMERLEQIDRANVELREMHAFLRSLGVERAITYPYDLLRADPGHKWGLSPFHFIADFYEFTMRSLEPYLLHPTI